MRFWWREVAGWLLVLLGLLVFYECFAFVTVHAVFEAGALTVIGVVLFRGGIHLLKVAVAARIATQAQEQAPGPRPGPARPAPLAPQRPAPARRT
jgi:hypothetical protein